MEEVEHPLLATEINGEGGPTIVPSARIEVCEYRAGLTTLGFILPALAGCHSSDRLVQVPHRAVAHSERKAGEDGLCATGIRFGAKCGQPGQDGVRHDLNRAPAANKAGDRERRD